MEIGFKKFCRMTMFLFFLVVLYYTVKTTRRIISGKNTETILHENIYIDNNSHYPSKNGEELEYGEQISYATSVLYILERLDILSKIKYCFDESTCSSNQGNNGEVLDGWTNYVIDKYINNLSFKKHTPVTLYNSIMGDNALHLSTINQNMFSGAKDSEVQNAGKKYSFSYNKTEKGKNIVCYSTIFNLNRMSYKTNEKLITDSINSEVISTRLQECFQGSDNACDYLKESPLYVLAFNNYKYNPIYSNEKKNTDKNEVILETQITLFNIKYRLAGIVFHDKKTNIEKGKYISIYFNDVLNNILDFDIYENKKTSLEKIEKILYLSNYTSIIDHYSKFKQKEPEEKKYTLKCNPSDYQVSFIVYVIDSKFSTV